MYSYFIRFKEKFYYVEKCRNIRFLCFRNFNLNLNCMFINLSNCDFLFGKMYLLVRRYVYMC